MVEYFFYEQRIGGKRSFISLGRDLLAAKIKWLELERTTEPSLVITSDERNLSSIYAKYMEWARNLEQSQLSARTIQDREKYWKQLEPAFGDVAIDDF